MQAALPLQPRRAMYGPLLRGGGELHIVGTDRVASVPDPDGTMHRLLVLADGSRSTRDLVAALAREYPQIDEGAVEATVERLTSAGILEDCVRRLG